MSSELQWSALSQECLPRPSLYGEVSKRAWPLWGDFVVRAWGRHPGWLLSLGPGWWWGGRTNEEILNHSAEGPGTRPSRETATCRLPLMGPKASAIMESFCSCGKSPGMQNYKSPICAGRREGCLSGRLTRKDLLVR